MKDLYIIGAGGFGREVAWLVERINKVTPTWKIKGFIDDNKDLWEKKTGNYYVVGGSEYLKSLGEVYVACAVGSATVRKCIIGDLRDCKVKFATLIDPSVVISQSVKIGEGTIICAGNIFTVDINIGNHVIVNLDCTIGHDVIISDFVTMYPSVNISGNVEIGKCVEFGTGSQIVQGKKIAEDVIIGAGAVVVKDITEPGTYVGAPARRV